MMGSLIKNVDYGVIIIVLWGGMSWLDILLCLILINEIYYS